MANFAWNITVKWNPKVDLDFDFIESLGKTWNKNIFFFGEVENANSNDILDVFKEKFEILNYDISVEGEDKVEILWESYEEWLYESASFEGEEVSFDEIKDRFWEFEEVVSIREAWISEKFWNKVIKVDFVY